MKSSILSFVLFDVLNMRTLRELTPLTLTRVHVLQTPHLVNLNEDPLMSECLLYYIKDGFTR